MTRRKFKGLDNRPSYLTFAQARVRGYSKSEWRRAKNIRSSLKKKNVLITAPSVSLKEHYRHSKVMLWSLASKKTYVPFLEIKAFIFTNGKGNIEIIEKKLNKAIEKKKNDYDFDRQFNKIRRRTAFEHTQISKNEVKEDHLIYTVTENGRVRFEKKESI